MDTLSLLSELKRKAAEDTRLREALIRTSEADRPMRAFCAVARSQGIDLYEMDLIEAGADFYASMKRSQNGGGENSPVLNNPSDYYESFVNDLRNG